MDQRPELQRGTIEFQVPKEYWTRDPAGLHIVFAIDVTWSSIQSGMLLAFCETMKAALYKDNILDPHIKIAIVTFDTSVHFYNLKVIGWEEHVGMKTRLTESRRLWVKHP